MHSDPFAIVDLVRSDEVLPPHVELLFYVLVRMDHGLTDGIAVNVRCCAGFGINPIFGL